MLISPFSGLTGDDTSLLVKNSRGRLLENVISFYHGSSSAPGLILHDFHLAKGTRPRSCPLRRMHQDQRSWLLLLLQRNCWCWQFSCLPSVLQLLQYPHAELTFPKVQNPLRLPQNMTVKRPKVVRTCGVLLLTFYFKNRHVATMAWTFWTSQLPKVIRS